LGLQLALQSQQRKPLGLTSLVLFIFIFFVGKIFGAATGAPVPATETAWIDLFGL
jgi:hypothetical protein